MVTATNQSLLDIAEKLGERLVSSGMVFATAESCTGGGVAFAVTAVAGSSAWFDRGFVVYTNQSKQEMLQVSPETLAGYGAVSEEVAREMAAGALAASHADISMAVTGIAGPGGGTKEKPVGTVCFAWQCKNADCRSQCYLLEGNRESIRQQSIRLALEGVLTLLEEIKAG